MPFPIFLVKQLVELLKSQEHTIILLEGTIPNDKTVS